MKKSFIAFFTSLVIYGIVGGAFLFAKNDSSSPALNTPKLPIVQARANSKLDYQENQVLVKLKNEKKSVKKFLKKESGLKEKIKPNTSQPIEEETPLENNPSHIYKVETKVNPVKAAREIKKQPEVEFAEPNYILETTLSPNDTKYSSQWGLRNAKLDKAWNNTTGSTNVTVAVVDTGADWNHPDLSANIWSNTDEAVNGVDSDSNSYIDDIRGWDFVTQTVCYPGEDCDGATDNNPMDFQGHGTAVSGIASAVTNNNTGIAGAGWSTKIMPVRAGYARAGDGRGALLTSDAANAIRYAATNNADIINLSWGSSSNSSTIESAIDYAFNQGLLIIAAAGNNGTFAKFYPASLNNVLSVGAITNTNQKWNSSNYGNWVDIAAPGKNIYTTVFNNTYVTASGTSLASPLVAGSAALVKAQLPGITNKEIARQLLSTGVNSKYYGIGCKLQTNKALRRVGPYPNGAIIKKRRNKKTYLIENGEKRLIPNRKVLNNRAFSRDVKNVSQATLSAYRRGNVIGFKDGTLVKIKNKNKYYLVNKQRYHVFRTNRLLRKMGFRTKSAIIIKKKALKRYHSKGDRMRVKNRYPDGTLIRRKGSSRIYVIKNGHRWAISPSVFSSWRYKRSAIISLSRNKFKQYPKKEILPHREGSLVRVGNGRVYYVQHNTLIAFNSGQMKRFGYRSREAFKISKSFQKKYKFGLIPNL